MLSSICLIVILRPTREYFSYVLLDDYERLQKVVYRATHAVICDFDFCGSIAYLQYSLYDKQIY